MAQGHHPARGPVPGSSPEALRAARARPIRRGAAEAGQRPLLLTREPLQEGRKCGHAVGHAVVGRRGGALLTRLLRRHSSIPSPAHYSGPRATRPTSPTC